LPEDEGDEDVLEERVLDWLMLPERIDEKLDEELLDEYKLDDRLLERLDDRLDERLLDKLLDRLDERLLEIRLEKLIGQPSVGEIVGMMVDGSVEIEAGYAQEQTDDIWETKEQAGVANDGKPLVVKVVAVVNCEQKEAAARM
jgi:hypothetical protein